MINKSKLSFLLISFISVLIFSCTLESDFDYTSNKDILTVNSILSPEKPVSLSITKVSPYPNKGDTFETVANANVLLFENETLLGSLLFNDSTLQYEMDYHPKVSANYYVEVDVPGYETLSAKTYIPEDFSGQNCYYFNPNMVARISLSDLGKDESYWIHFISKVWYRDILEDSSYYVEGSIWSPISDEKIFDDFNVDHFDSKTSYSKYLRIGDEVENIQFEVTSWETLYWFRNFRPEDLKEEEYLDMVVFKASPEMDKYWKAILVNYENSNFEEPNPFYEPISGYSNIENGTGIFAGINIKRISLIENKCN